MGSMLRASLGSPAVFALVLVAACSAQPLTPEQGATQGSGLSGKYQAAYAKCMKENQPE
jgi:hypothetical protein